MLEQLRARIVRQGPSLLRVPLKFTPFALQRQLLEQVLGWQFRQALADGDLEFLESRWLKIEVRDLALHWFMTVENGKLVVSKIPIRCSFSVGCRLKGTPNWACM